MNSPTIQILGSVCFGFAILHTFLTSVFKQIAARHPEGSLKENFFHLLGEVEVVFGFWAAILLGLMALSSGPQPAIEYLESRNFSEPIFVFVVLACCSTKPILSAAEGLLLALAKILPLSLPVACFFVCLILGPLLGSFITEPAAMTLTALLIKDFFFDRGVSTRFKYITLAVLFVNVSVGGALTPYAAPPVLMVAAKWNYTLETMFSLYGWKAILICVVNTFFAYFFVRPELRKLKQVQMRSTKRSPVLLILVHLVFLTLIVVGHKYATVVLGFFLLFLGVFNITQEYQSDLKLKESLLVSLFLAGLVILGGFQSWWLKPLVETLQSGALFLGATGLTAVVDNAALTYLGAQLSEISDSFKYALVAGALTGGGLTVIANAPNPAGYSILQNSFGAEGIRPGKLFAYAVIPTIVATVIFWGLRPF